MLFLFRLSAAEYLVQGSATDLFNRHATPGRVPAELRSRVSPEPSGRRGLPDLFDDSAVRECDESRGTRCSERLFAQIGLVARSGQSVGGFTHMVPLYVKRLIDVLEDR